MGINPQPGFSGTGGLARKTRDMSTSSIPGVRKSNEVTPGQICSLHSLEVRDSEG